MARMNDIVSEAFGRLERAVQAQQSPSQQESGHATLIKDAKMLAVPAAAATAGTASILASLIRVAWPDSCWLGDCCACTARSRRPNASLTMSFIRAISLTR